MKKRKKKEKKPLSPTLNKMWLAALIIFPIVLWIMPADFFDSSDLILCPSRLFFDFECYGCGLTRAIMHLHHFDFEEALYFNGFSYFMYPAFISVWFIWIKTAYQDFKNPPIVQAPVADVNATGK
ncbi:MAG: hypothetical protein ACI85O_003697 [Saprospiraceae bacterium]|jgi:hypothetical protein